MTRGHLGGAYAPFAPPLGSGTDSERCKIFRHLTSDGLYINCVIGDGFEYGVQRIIFSSFYEHFLKVK